MTLPAPQDSPADDPYAVLGAAPTATDEEVKQAYFAQVRVHPPEADPQAFKRIRAAYERLRTPDKRLETDMLRLEPWPEPSWREGTFAASESALDPSVSPEDVIRAARAWSDLGRHDFREDYREVKW